MTGRSRNGIVLILALVGASTLLALSEFRSAVPSQAARRLHAVAAPDPEPVRSSLLAWSSTSDGLIGKCPPGAVDAVIELDALNADLHTPLTHRAEWVEALVRLESDARDALACQPTNGLAWARLAFASWFLGQSADRQAQYLDFSQLYAPAEMGPLRARFAQWARVTPYVTREASRAFERDLRTILASAPVSFAISVLESMPPSSGPAILEVVRVLPQERLNALSARGFNPSLWEAAEEGSMREPLPSR